MSTFKPKSSRQRKPISENGPTYDPEWWQKMGALTQQRFLEIAARSRVARKAVDDSLRDVILCKMYELVFLGNSAGLRLSSNEPIVGNKKATQKSDEALAAFNRAIALLKLATEGSEQTAQATRNASVLQVAVWCLDALFGANPLSNKQKVLLGNDTKSIEHTAKKTSSLQLQQQKESMRKGRQRAKRSAAVQSDAQLESNRAMLQLLDLYDEDNPVT